MEIRELSRQGLSALYAVELVHTFPPSELKPLSSMEQQMDRGCYRPLALFDGETPVSYLLLWTDQTGRYALIDYLCTTPSRRGDGLGGRFLQLFYAAYPEFRCVLVESEAPTGGDPVTDSLRRRRLAFYERCGMRRLDYDCALFGVHYRCLVRGEIDNGEALHAHQAIYAQQFSPGQLKRFIQLPLRPGEAVRNVTEWKEV